MTTATHTATRLRNLLDELPDYGSKRLMDIEREVRNEPTLRRLAVDLCAKWRSRYATNACAACAIRTM